MSHEPPRPSESINTGNSVEPSYEGMPYAALRRYVAGASDADERRRVSAWAAESGARRAYLEALTRTWGRGPTAAGATEVGAGASGTGTGEGRTVDAAWVALRDRMEVPPGDTAPYVAPWQEPAVEIDVGHRARRRPARLLTNAFGERRRWPLVPLAAAATIALAAAGGVLVRRSLDERASAEALVAMREVTTGVGQRAEVKLGDGSVVTLASKSRLRFPADFGARSRELQLEGQGYFKVVHDPSRPFAVHAGGSKTIDIGTAFVIRAYPEDARVDVVVEEGSVALERDRPNAARALLTAGLMGQLARGAATPSVRHVDPSRYTGWLTGRLVFEDASLADVARELGRWYDVEVRFADPSIARETFTASFTSESLAETLATLTTVIPLRAERQGKVVVLRRLTR